MLLWIDHREPFLWCPHHLQACQLGGRELTTIILTRKPLLLCPLPQATPGRDARSYSEIQKYLQSDYSARSVKLDDDSSSTMTRVLARLSRSQATEPTSATNDLCD